MSSPGFGVRFFKIVSDISIWVILVFIEVVLSDRNIWKDQKVKNLHKIHFDELSLTWHESNFTHILDS